MEFLKHYVRIHLTGAAAGIELFARGSALHEDEARRTTGRIRDELFEERAFLLDVAQQIGASDPVLPSIAARLGERLGRLKPNGSLVRRTELTDVIDLEAMHDAVSGKVAGWRALLEVDDSRIDRAEVQRLLDQGVRQLDDLSALHASACRRAFG